MPLSSTGVADKSATYSVHWLAVHSDMNVTSKLLGGLGGKLGGLVRVASKERTGGLRVGGGAGGRDRPELTVCCNRSVTVLPMSWHDCEPRTAQQDAKVGRVVPEHQGTRMSAVTRYLYGSSCPMLRAHQECWQTTVQHIRCQATLRVSCIS